MADGFTLWLTGLSGAGKSTLAREAEPLLHVHSPHPKPFERGVVACTGSEFCRLAIVESKARAAPMGA